MNEIKENGNYICGAYLVKSNNQNDTNTYKYTTCNLNLRKGPSTNYAKILLNTEKLTDIDK